MNSIDVAKFRDTHRQIMELCNSGQPAQAAEVCQQLLTDLSGLPHNQTIYDLRARSLASLATCQFELVGESAAMGTLASAELEARKCADPNPLAQVLVQRALVLTHNRKLSAALSCLNEAAKHLPEMSPYDRLRVLINRAVTNLYLGSIEDAESDLYAAKEIAVVEKFGRQLHQSLGNLAYAALMKGDLLRSLSLLDEAILVPKYGKHPGTYLELGRVLFEAGLLRESLIEFEKIFRQRDISLKHLRAEAQLEASRSHLMLGNTSKAKRLSRAAQNSFNQRQVGLWAVRARLVELQASQGNTQDVATEARNLILIAKQFGDFGTANEARVIAASVCLDEHDLDDAREHLAQLTLSTNTPLVQRLTILHLRARLAICVRALREARKHLRLAAREISRYAGSAASIDLRTSVTYHACGLYETHLEQALQVGPLAVVKTSELWRGAVHSAVTSLPSPNGRAQHLLQQLRVTDLAISEAATRPELPRLQKKLGRLHHELRQVAWRNTTKAGSIDSASLPRNLTSTISETGWDVAYFVELAGQVSRVSIGHGRAKLFHIGEKYDVARKILELNHLLSVGNSGVPDRVRKTVITKVRNILRELGGQLFGDCATSSPLVVVPTAAVATAPFALFPQRTGLPTVVAPTLNQWVTSNEQVSHPHGKPWIGWGPGLPGAEEESKRVSEIWRNTHPPTMSTRSEVIDALGSYEVVHLAAHGRHIGESPLFSHLVLADGPLYTYELTSKTIRTRHLVLGSCEVGESNWRPLDQPLGLVSVLIGMGVPCITAAVGPVSDEGSYAFLSRYHEYLSGGAAPAEALAYAHAEHQSFPVPYSVYGASIR